MLPPPALIVILTDLEVAARESLQVEHDQANWMDVGTAAMNMMNMAHAVGLGSCPVTFSHQVPPSCSTCRRTVPEWILIVGHPKPQARHQALRRNRSVLAT